MLRLTRQTAIRTLSNLNVVSGGGRGMATGSNAAMSQRAAEAKKIAELKAVADLFLAAEAPWLASQDMASVGGGSKEFVRAHGIDKAQTNFKRGKVVTSK